MTPSEVIVICTRNRPADLARCLDSISAETDRPTRIVLIDASDDESSARVAETAARNAHNLAIEVVRTQPGLARQRNEGIDKTHEDIVHLIDDDVILEPGYFAALREVFSGDKTEAIGGVAPLIANLGAFRPGLLRRLLAPRSTRQGAVLASGRGIHVYDITEPTNVEWLSTCAVAYRRRLLDDYRFDESLPQYSLGEDLDFSYRAGQRFMLVVTPHARVQHNASETNRLAEAELARLDVINRHRRASSGVGALRPLAFWTDLVAELALYSARALLPGATPSRARLKGTLSAAAHILSQQIR